MIEPGTIYVVTVGRRYVRFPDEEILIVGQHVIHACDFGSMKAAQQARDRLKPLTKKEVRAFQIVVTEIP